MKTAIVAGAGCWGEIHPVYRSYARAVGFHIDACPPGAPEAKGKAEAKVRLSRLRLDPSRRRWDSLEELQEQTDERIGRTVLVSWEVELEKLAPLPLLPEPFDLVATRPVHKDCTVRFEDRSYTVPFSLVGQRVEIRGCATTVQILAGGGVVREYPRGTEQRLWIDPSCYEGEPTDRVRPPQPLGKMGRRLQELYELPVGNFDFAFQPSVEKSRIETLATSAPASRASPDA